VAFAAQAQTSAEGYAEKAAIGATVASYEAAMTHPTLTRSSHFMQRTA